MLLILSLQREFAMAHWNTYRVCTRPLLNIAWYTRLFLAHYGLMWSHLSLSRFLFFSLNDDGYRMERPVVFDGRLLWLTLLFWVRMVTGNSSWDCSWTKRKMTQGGNYWWGRWCQPKPYLPCRCPRGKGRNYKRPTIMGLEASDYN